MAKMPVRRPNADTRTREYLTEIEMGKLIKAAKKNRWGHRDTTMILVAYRHGLRSAELVGLRWDQVEFGRNASIHVRRVKNGTPSVHPLPGDELRALRQIQREQEPKSPFVFTSERGSPFTTAGFARMVERAGIEAGFLIQGAPTHATPRVRLHTGKQRARHSRVAGLPRTQEHSAHGALYRYGTNSVQEFLA